MSQEKGLHLGHFYDPQTGRYGPRQVYSGDRHAFVCAPTGSGKSARLVAVNLLSDCLDDRSVIVIDPKGELSMVCMKHRHRLGHAVHLIDPYGKVKEMAAKKPDAYRYLIENGLTESLGFNPCSSLHTDHTFYDRAAQLADAMIEIRGTDPHWTESAQGLMTGLLMWEKRLKGTAANLENLRAMLVEPNEYEDVAGPDGKSFPQLKSGFTMTARRMVDEGGYEIASLAGRFARVMTREMQGIQSTADTQTRWIISKPMRADLKKPGIDFGELKQRPTSVFVVLPSEKMSQNAPWLRLLLVCALGALCRPGGLRTMIFIDEMPVLGYLRPLAEAYGLIRGMRVQIIGFVQNLGQLKRLYKDDWETMIANSGVVQCLAPNDLTTAEWMSKRSGQSTVLAKGVSESDGISPGGNSERESTSWQQVGRPAYLPDELFGLEEGTGLAWLAGMRHTIKFLAPAYFELEQCAARALPNPYYLQHR